MLSKNNLGWVSPTGYFYKCDFGEHESTAWQIIKSKYFTSEFMNWKREHRNCTFGDFLVEEKGYLLINEPALNGRVQITYRHPWTRKQRDFLFEYYTDRQEWGKANAVLRDPYLTYISAGAL